MKKIRVDDCICKAQMSDHHVLKNMILKSIDHNNHLEEIRSKEGFDNIKVTRADYSAMESMDRPWVQKFLPNFKITMRTMLSSLGYTGYLPTALWYHQYSEGDKYGWHIHDNQYGGIYYLEMGRSSARTEFLYPFNRKKVKINVKEGDMIIFPGHLMHRGLLNGKDRKTVISFNFNLDVNSPLDLSIVPGASQKDLPMMTTWTITTPKT